MDIAKGSPNVSKGELLAGEDVSTAAIYHRFLSCYDNIISTITTINHIISTLIISNNLLKDTIKL
jgi:hypothetical protein